MPKPTMRQIELKVAEFERAGGGWSVQPGTDEWRSAVLLLAAHFCHCYDVEGLAEFTGYDPVWIAVRKTRLEANGIWFNNQDYQDWFQVDGYGCICFWSDVLVAQGFARRVIDEGGQMCWGKALDAPPLTTTA